jgi:cytochrome c peroxidase
MNLNIKLFLILFLISQNLFADSKSEILKKAILDNGFEVDPSKLEILDDSKLSDIGAKFFESNHLSLNGNISCKTCHNPKTSTIDKIPNASGVLGHGEGYDRLKSGGKVVPRNTIALFGVGGKDFKTFFWDGRVDFSNTKKTLSQFGKNIPSKDPLITAVHLPVVEIRETLLEDDLVLQNKKEDVSGANQIYTAVINNLNEHEGDAIKELAFLLDKKESQVNFLDIARSIAAFIRSEFSIKETKLHRFVANKGKLTEDELKGGIVFYGKGNCISCHSGPYFTNHKFYTIPFPQLGFGKNGFGVDYGRYNATFNPDDLYKFRTPTLFNVSKTAPYGHSGSIHTLENTILAHFDPLKLIDLNKMNGLQRFEFYKYLQRTDQVKSINFLDQEEINQLVKFISTLEF